MAGPTKGCGCMTSRTGCLIIGWLEVTFLIPLFLGGLVLITIGYVGLPIECGLKEVSTTSNECWDLIYSQYFVVAGTITLALGTLYLFAPCCLIHGASKGKPSFVMAYIVCSTLRNIISFVNILAASRYHAPLPLLDFTLILFAFQVYQTVVATYHYNYLSENREGDNELLCMTSADSSKLDDSV